MPNRTINQLDPNAGLTGTEEVPIWNTDDSSSEKTTVDAIKQYVIDGVSYMPAIPDYIPPQNSPGTIWPWQEGLLFYDWTSHTWCYYNEHTGVTVNLGEENVVHGVNKDDVIMSDGFAVLASGQQGPQPKFLCAQGDSEANASGTIAVVTHTIAINAQGVATSFGLVRNFDTTGTPYGETWAAGDRLWVSPTTKGHPTNIKPAYPNYAVCIGEVMYAHNNNGVILVGVDRIDGAIEKAIQTRKPFHGVESGETLTFDTGTKIATLAPAGGTFAYWWKGTRFVTDQAITIDLSGEIANSGADVGYFIYFQDATGVPIVSPGPWNIQEDVPYAVVFWNGTVARVIDERHGYTRDLAWHTWAHLTVGVRWRTGFDLLTLTGTGAAASMTLSGGELMDEDLRTVIQASANWDTPNAYAHFYQTAAGTYTCKDSLSTIPFLAGANNRPQLVNVSTYTLTEVASAPNRYCNFFVYGIQDPIAPVWIFAETVSNATATAGGYTTLANARAAGWPNLSGLNLSPELKPLYRVVVRADGVVQATIAADDYRNVSSLPQAAGSASTTASIVTFAPVGDIAATTVQSAIEELDTEKQPLTAKLLAKTGAYTLTAAENGKMVHCDGTFTITLPQVSTEDLPDGFTAIVWNIGTGVITLAIEGSDVLTSTAATIPSKKAATVWKRTDAAWCAAGGLG